MPSKPYTPEVRRSLILTAAVVLSEKPGGWSTLTRALIAAKAGCAESLVSRYLGNMGSVRKAVIEVAISNNIQEIIVQSVAAHDGYVKNRSVVLG